MVGIKITGFVVGLFLLTSAAYGVEKFAVVDLQKALNLSKAGKDAKETFGKKVESAQKLVETREQELKRLQTEFEKQGLLLSADARVEKTKEFEAKRRDFERYVKDSREELAMEERRITNKILEEIEKVVQRIGKEEGYTLIFERFQSGILHVKDALDITERTIKLYDAQKK